ncbi:MAG: type II toxin-antitoxin system Phd/YefM family antitoxin [Janthinobacterium lividum]
MTTISIDEIQYDLAGYLTRVQAGETLLITQAGRPVAEINPVKSVMPDVQQALRPIGLADGEFVVPDDFDDPLPDELQRLFEGR